MTRLKLILDRILGAMKSICGVCLCVVFAFSFINILTRNIFSVSWLFIPGITKTAFLWMVFSGIAVLYRTGDHLKMDFFSMKFNTDVLRATKYFFLAIEAVLLVVLTIYGFRITAVRMTINFETWRFPTGYAYLALPVNSTIMLLFNIERFLKLSGGKKK